MKDYIKNQKKVRKETGSQGKPIADKVHSKMESDLYGKVVKKAIEKAKKVKNAKDVELQKVSK